MKYIFLLAALFVAQISFSQMDERFYFPSKQWKSTEGFEFEEHFFYRENDTLSTVLIHPEGKAKASILYFHGSGGNVTTYMPLAKPLVDAGYRVFMVDFRGYGKSSGKPTHVNIAADAQFLLEKMQQMPFMANKPLLIYGSSMGTQVAINLTRKNQESISGLILDGTVASFTDVALQYAPPAAHEMIRSQAGVFPYSAKEDIVYIENLPILFIHSKEDKEISYEQGKMVYDAAVAPKSFWTYEGGHLKAPALFPEELVRRIDALLEK